MTLAGIVSMRRTSSEVTIRLPSGTMPGSDLTREPVARITSVALSSRSPPAPGVPSSPALADADLGGAVEAAAALDPGHVVLLDEGL